MSFTPAPVSPAISAEASIPAPRLLKRSYLAALCFFLILLVCGAGSVSLAQTAYFSGAQTILGSGFSDPAAVA